MTPKELLTPRFKVIADWLGNDYMPVGTILTLNDEKETTCDGELATVIIVPSDINDSDMTLPFMVNEKQLRAYPHLFKRLKWHEERNPEEMPLYLKDAFIPVTSEYHRVYKASYDIPGNTIFLNNCPFTFYGRIHQLVPATESEYLKNQP